MSRPDPASVPAGEAGRPLIAATAIGLALGGHPILAGVDVSVDQGEIVTVIGPNGAGKTTLIKVLLDLLPADVGTVWRRPGLCIGYVPQRLRLDRTLPLTVGRLMTLTARRPPTAVRAALAETGVEALFPASVHTLSSGELQRVLLARALLRDPDLLVLDEPVQGVDFGGQAALYTLIGAIRDRRRCGVLLVSHDLHLVMAATDHVLCLNRHVCCAGEPEAVGRHPEYARLFGRHATAFGVYEHHHDHAHALSGDTVAAVPPGDKARSGA